ncbi:hypothetical protein AX17_001019 [Amanita inopinata Kibby_2008]|nr:hypothetical protein AX17_001019 [Amanita inopinata Kibby_2008]
MESGDNRERASFLSVRSLRPSHDTIAKLVSRLRALVLQLLPVEVEPAAISNATSHIITPQVISAFMAAAGDFVEALPYALLRAKAQFMRDANTNPADYGENFGRAVACEVLARRIVHLSPRERLTSIMSTRFQHKQVDRDSSEMSSALELAIDQNCAIFLSSSEAQDVVHALWKGDIIQKNNEHHDIDYVPFAEVREHSFWSHFDASRLAVPRYQNAFRIIVWLFFLVVYSQAVREPLERLDQLHSSLDGWEIVLYVMTLAFTVEDVHKFWVLLRFATWRALNFWSVIALATDAILFSAFVLRIAGIGASGEHAAALRLRSFRILSCVSPLIWTKLVTIFDGFKYIGTMQICVARMLKESGIFFALLSVLAIGFYQGLYALDAADGTVDNTSEVINLLMQALLQSPNYGKFSESPTGLLLFYLWNTVTAIILLNVLISLFSSAYSDVVADAEAQYLAFFASKTISMIRAPDSYVYPAPFNLVEIFFVAPFEFFPRFRLSVDTYAKLNRYVMTFIFFIPLSILALYESSRETKRGTWVETWLLGDEGDEDSPEIRNPEVNDPACNGKKISKVPFEELIKVFPNTKQSSDVTILKEIGEIKEYLIALTRDQHTMRTPQSD